jgi:hypothetical protein
LIPNLVTISTDQVGLSGITYIGICEYEALSHAQKRIPYFIVEVYNRKLPHSSLGCFTPNKFEKMFRQNSCSLVREEL